MPRPLNHLLASAALGALALTAACASAPAPTPDPAPARQEAAPPPAAPPAWIEGDYPQEPLLFGRGAGNAPDHAREAAVPALQQELEILARILKKDHEEQVAEIITRYPPADFNARVDQAVQRVLTDAAPHATYADKQKVDAVFVLLAADPGALFDALEASDLPAEQKSRLRDYRATFINNALTNLGRR